MSRVYRVSARSTLQGQTVVNTFHVATKTGTGAWLYPFDVTATPQDVADHFNTKLSTLYRAMLTTDGVFHDWTVADEHDPQNPTRTPEVAVKSVELAGTRSNGTGTEIALQMCGMARLKTGKGGRFFHGRAYLPPVVERAQCVDQDLSAGGSYLVACSAFLTELAKGFDGGSAWPTPWPDWEANVVVYSRRRRALVLDDFYAKVKSATMDTKLHWLRSRTP